MREAQTKEFLDELEHALKSSGFPEDASSKLKHTVDPNMLRAKPFSALSDMQHRALRALRKDMDMIIFRPTRDGRRTSLTKPTTFRKQNKY